MARGILALSVQGWLLPMMKRVHKEIAWRRGDENTSHSRFSFRVLAIDVIKIMTTLPFYVQSTSDFVFSSLNFSNFDADIRIGYDNSSKLSSPENIPMSDRPVIRGR